MHDGQEHDDLRRRIRAVVTQHARINGGLHIVGDTTDLYEAGMTSHGSVAVMTELEAEFGIEFPESLIKRSVFCSVASLEAAIATLLDLRSPYDQQLGAQY